MGPGAGISITINRICYSQKISKERINRYGLCEIARLSFL
ncbi:hypothetical protein DesyoDRAFT_0021 [Desulfosporosinus youngiae DSM 17734]|uniref:Uncharacterized protein n=1 Tax=Desulfosporosinus youngiae DSM 17734 TaxID=768710 RepID=H5Y135_9FIRM|nr:hypothetical protein DesyoDRAFT_0021 [Desulfosporosinus youngiae DSM 17734]